MSWRIINRGKEAAKANVLEEKLDCYKDKTMVEVDAAYLGHHFMECVLKRTYEEDNRRIRFGVYVR